MDIKLHTSDIWTLLKPFVKMQFTGRPPDPDDIFKILDIVVNLLEGKEDGEVLSRIDENVRRLIEMPMKTAQDHLRNALAAADENNKRTWLYEAINEFTHAKNVDLPPQNIRAMTYIALCFQCLGETGLAARWYQDSYTEAIRQWNDCQQAVARLERPPVLERAIFWAVLIPGAALAGASFIGVIPLTKISQRMNTSYYLALVTLFDLEKQLLYLKECTPPEKLPPFPNLYFSQDICRVIRHHVSFRYRNTASAPKVLPQAAENGTILQCYDAQNTLLRTIDLNQERRYAIFNRQTPPSS